MTYKIERGDVFQCIKTFRMESGEKAYTRGSDYLSEINSNITDDDMDAYHNMEIDPVEFFTHFKLIAEK